MSLPTTIQRTCFMPVVLLSLACNLSPFSREGLAEDQPLYLNPKAPIEKRIDDLLPRMTLEDKLSQLRDDWGSKGVARLKIPPMLKTEGLHGQSYSEGATIFPQGIAMASTFNTPLIQEVGKATAIESKANSIRVSWSPVLDVARDARWGRVEETYGEDPFLVGRMGVAWISGFQGEDMIAVPKHFAGHGEPRGGRDSHDVGLSDRVMRNIHLPPFRDAIKEARAGGVMAAYSAWNAVPDNGSVELLQKILREEWGFDGFVVSDCSGPENLLNKQSVVNNLEEATRASIIAGVDDECGSAYKGFLIKAVESGVLKETDLDQNLRRMLRAKFKLGLFENPTSERLVWKKLPEYDTPERRALARRVAVEGSVLLKNKDKLLPLSKELKTIAVIGPNADAAQTGDYSARAVPDQLKSVLDGVKSHVSSSTKVLYAKGCDHNSQDSSGFAEAVDTAKQADAVVLVVGDCSGGYKKLKETTGENVDGATLEIPGVQRQLIKEISATGKPVVLVLVNGKPFTLAWEAENIPAILVTWYPGEEGGNATADLLFGDANPSGRLPITFPQHVGQLPLNYDYETSGRNYDYFDMSFAPLYRFGHGLSYTTFNYSNLQVAQKKEDPGSVSVSVDIENTGDRDGAEVAQLYVTDDTASVVTPVIQLKGFQRVELKKGEKKSVRFELTPYQLSLLNPEMVRVLEPGKFRVHVGTVSPSIAPDGSGRTPNAGHKQKIAFKDARQGVTGEFDVPSKYEAEFVHQLKVPASVRGGDEFDATVTVTNRGNLLDIAEVELYGDTLLDSRRCELAPGETRSFTFKAAISNSGKQNLFALVGKKVATAPLTVAKSPARLILDNAVTSIGEDGLLRYAAKARNSGSETFKGVITIIVDGKTAASLPVELAPGNRRDVSLTYAFPHAGAFRIKVANGAEQSVVIPGGISLALQEPMLAFNFDADQGTSVKDGVSGNSLPVSGTPQFVEGKKGKALRSEDKATFVKLGNLDIYRKSFTLAAWVKVEDFEGGKLALFGGQAPMGADVDNTGTILSVGFNDKSPFLDFLHRTTKGKTQVAPGEWVHVAYTYNAQLEEGSVYLNGNLDKSEKQKPYAGPLETLGSAPLLNHGKFAVDEVLVARTCMPKRAIQDLAKGGLDALCKGSAATEWRPISSPLKSLQATAEIPANSQIKLVVETGDGSGKAIDSKTFELKQGEQNFALEGLKPGAEARVRVELVSSKLGAVPSLQTAQLNGADVSLRWSTVSEWKKASTSGGLQVGR